MNAMITNDYSNRLTVYRYLAKYTELEIGTDSQNDLCQTMTCPRKPRSQKLTT